VNKGNPTEEF